LPSFEILLVKIYRLFEEKKRAGKHFKLAVKEMEAAHFAETWVHLHYTPTHAKHAFSNLIMRGLGMEAQTKE
jgi:hypothetical protein